MTEKTNKPTKRRLTAAEQMQLDGLYRQRQAIAFDANVQRIYKVNTPYAIQCLKKYEALTEAIEAIENPPAPEPVQGRLL